MPLRLALQTWGWAPLQRFWPTAQVGVAHVPVVAWHSAAVTQAEPVLSQPLRLALQT